MVDFVFHFQGPHSYGVRTFFSWIICPWAFSELLGFFSPSSNWLGQVMWHKKYWWHHSTLSTRPHSSTSLVTSVKVSWLRPRTPKVSFENYTWFWLSQLNYKWLRPRTPEHALWNYNWFWLTQLNSTINGFDQELLDVLYENYTWFD